MLIIAFATFFLYYDCLMTSDFVYDDHFIVQKQPLIQKLTPNAIREIFTSTSEGHYLPIRILSYSLDYTLWGGLDSFGFHLTNILLHAANAILLAAFGALLMTAGGLRKTTAWITASVAALLFAAHPQNTETVAWISCRKDLLATFFSLASALCYFQIDHKHKYRIPLYIASILTFTCALMSKASTVAMPLIILAIAILLHGHTRPILRRIALTIPFFLIDIAILALDMHMSREAGIIAPLNGGSPATHLMTISKIPLLYINHMFIPLNLAAEYPVIVETSLLSPLVISSLIVITLTTWLTIHLLRHDRPAALLLLWTAINLIPMMNLIPTIKLISDRYSYLPLATLFPLLAYLITRLTIKKRLLIIPLILITAATLALSAKLTLTQAKIWHSDLTLFQATALVSPRDPVVLHNLGYAYYQAHNIPAAIEYTQKAIAIDPSDVAALVNLGSIQQDALHDTPAAIASFKKALEYSPKNPQIMINLATCYYLIGDYPQAEKTIQKTLRLAPDNTAYQKRAMLILQEIYQKQTAPSTPPTEDCQ